MCKKQTSVPHSSTESEIISLDEGLILDGIPTLEFWNLIISVLHWNTIQSKQAQGNLFTSPTRKNSWNDWCSGQCWFLFLRTWILLVRMALLFVEDNEAVTKMITKGRSPTKTCFQNPQSCSRLVIWSKQNGPQDPKQKHWPRTNSQKYWQREISHVMNGIIFCVCSTSTIFSSTNCLEVMSKRTQEDAGEEKSHSKIEADDEFGLSMLDVLASIASESRENQTWKSIFLRTEQHCRTERPVVNAYSSTYSKWNIDEKWFSQECTSDQMMEARRWRPLGKQPAGSFTQHTDRFVMDDDEMDSNTVKESDLSLKSRSFLRRVSDRVRKILDQSAKDAMQDSDKHSFISRIFMSSTLEASVFMGKNYSENVRSIKNTGNNLTLKQMFDTSEKLIVLEADGIYGVSAKKLGRFFMETVIFGQRRRSHQSLAHKGLRIFRFCIVSWKDEREPSIKYWCIGKTDWRGSKVYQNTELWTELMGSQWNSSGISSQDSPHCSSATKSKSSSLEWATHQNSKDANYLHVDVQWHNMVNYIQWTGMHCWCHTCDYIYKEIPSRKMVILPDPDQKRSGFLLLLTDHKENGTGSLKRWWSDSEKADTQSFPSHESVVPRHAQKQRRLKIINTLLRWWRTIETVFRIIISVNQLSLYGAVSDVCEEYRICQARTGRLVLADQSDPLFEPACLLSTTPTPPTEVPSQEDLLQKYKERVERLSQQNRVIKICTDAGFLTTLEVGQYFMTKDTEEFSQFTESVACREYILPRDEKSSDPKGWNRGNTKIGPLWKSQPATNKVNMKLKLELNL